MNDTFPPARLELMRSKLPDEVVAATEVLTDAGVPHHVSNNSGVFDIMTMGTTEYPHDIILTVASTDFERAREAMEKAYADSELPEGHFLLSASDDEVADILENPSTWSAFDVAHARRIAKARGVDPQLIVAKHDTRVQRLREGAIPLPWWVALGWVLAFFGGIFGIVCGYAIAFSKEQTADGEFYVYDERARATGKFMMAFGIFMAIVIQIAMFNRP